MNAAVLLVFGCFYITTISQQCAWKELNLEPLSKLTIQCVFSEYSLLYTPCRDDVSCGIGGKYMTVLDSVSTCEAFIAEWDSSVVPKESNDDNNTVFTFDYSNGQISGGCSDYRNFTVEYVCDPTAYPYAPDKLLCGEVEMCVYYMRIYTSLACNPTTTTSTTTKMPQKECIWSSSDGEHILDLNNIRGDTFTHPSDYNESLIYSLSPCDNLLRCGNVYSMSAIFNVNEGECSRYLAIFNKGNVQPNYNLQLASWQFIYTNGESCNGFSSDLHIYWNCDKESTETEIVRAYQASPCLNVIEIQSKYACD